MAFIDTPEIAINEDSWRLKVTNVAEMQLT